MRSSLPLIFTALFVSSSLAASADEWRSRSIYQLVTDRFAQPGSSGPACDTAARKYCGGTWKGIVNHLDYIQNMGFDAIWISPIVANINGSTAYGEAFHGYWTADINSLNSHFGTADDLKALGDALHKRGMFLMVDVVANHMAATALPPNFASLSPFNDQAEPDVEQCWLGDKDVPLPDLNTEDPNIVNTLNTWIKNLVSEHSIDGLRIDTVKHIRKDFWPGFASAAGVFTIGEVLINDTDYAAPYTQVIDSVLDYPTYFSLVSAFSTPQGNLSALASVAQQTQTKYKTGAFNGGSFLENHDQPRFQSITEDQALVRNAMAWTFVNDGIPILYYGQEQAYSGGTDPSNREALWFTEYDQDKPLVSHVKVLNAARKAAATTVTFHTTPMKVLSTTSSAMALSKPPLLALLSNGGSSSAPSWTVPNAGYTANEDLVDALSCRSVQADASGGVSTSSSGGAPMVLLPKAALGKSGLCGTSGGTITSSGRAEAAVRGIAPVLAAAIAFLFLV